MAADRFPSTDDARAANSPVRHAYRVLTDEEKERVSKVKDAGEAFLDLLATLPQGREVALARTKIEEAIMWATKGIIA